MDFKRYNLCFRLHREEQWIHNLPVFESSGMATIPVDGLES